MYIYIITNRETGKQYVGQTIRSIDRRWAQHTAPSSKGCFALKSAIMKYGKENFEVELLAEADSLEELNRLEKSFIEIKNTMYPTGYNLTTGGGCYVMADSTKLKMSKIHKGKKLSKGHAEALHSGRRGNKNSEGHRKAISESQKGRLRPKQHCENISKAKKGKPQTKLMVPVYGINTEGQCWFFRSASEAKKFGFNQGHLSECIRGGRKSHHGFRWHLLSVIIKSDLDLKDKICIYTKLLT